MVVCKPSVPRKETVAIVRMESPPRDEMTDVGGAMTGTMKFLALYYSDVLLNTTTGNTTGTVQIGGDLTSSGSVQFKGCLDAGSYDFSCLEILGSNQGQITRSFCSGVTVDVVTCP